MEKDLQRQQDLGTGFALHAVEHLQVALDRHLVHHETGRGNAGRVEAREGVRDEIAVMWIRQG